MSYGIIRIQKMKTGSVKGIEIHDKREKGSLTNPDIDKSKSINNYNLHNSINEDLSYRRLIKKRIEELNLPRAVRKDAIVMTQCLITSDKDFFDRLSPKEQVKFFKDSFEFIKNRYGEKNIISATVHLDEKTPHMHVNFVPVTNDGRLSAKDLFKKYDLTMLHDDFYKQVAKGFGLDRGETREEKRKHLDTQTFKEITLKEKIKTLEQETDTLKNDLNALKRDLNRVNNIKVCFHEVDSIEGKYGLLNKQKVTIDADDFQMLKDMAKKHHILDSKIKNLEHENSDMKSDISKFVKTKNKELDKDRNLQVDLNRANKRLSSITKEFEIVVKFLDETGQLDNTRRYLKKELDQEKQYKYKLKDIELEK